ncbi:MAG: cyclic nucleotide-binding and patatin-like phospholipase domain-containing protein [Polyangiales bacterium]
MSEITRDSLLAEHLDWILETTFLARLTLEEQASVLGAMSWRRYGPGEVFVRAGSPPPGVDLIIEGQVLVERNGPAAMSRVLGPGHLIGERSLLRASPTVADVKALSPVRALHLTPDAFRALLVRAPHLRADFDALVELRERLPVLLELFLQNSTLRLIGRDGLEQLLDVATFEQLPAGRHILQAGDRSRDVYLLVRGRVVVYAPPTPDRPREVLAIEGPGALLGHAAALLELPRTADVETVEPTEILTVPARAFMDVVSQNPSLQRRLFQQLATMDLRAHDARRAGGAGILVSVYGTRDRVGATTLAYGLASELSQAAPTVLVDLAGAQSARRLGMKTVDSAVEGVDVTRLEAPAAWPFQVLWPRDPDRALALVQRLRERDGRNSHVVVAASSQGAADLGVMGACEALVLVRHADEVTHTESARHGQFRVEALRLRPGLAVLPHTGPHAVRVPEDAPAASAFWRTGDPKVLRDEASGLGRASRRLARVLQGRSVGLALGGGGALGFAHIGLIRVMRAAGVPIDYVAGSSFGSLVAGIYAAGGLDALDALIRERVRLQAHVWGAMLWSKLVARFVDDLVGARQMAETEIAFLPVSMDLLTGRQVVLSHGTIGEGVRSSSCLPGPFAAYRTGSWRLADGGIINNVPASVTWEAGAHFIVASNIIPRSTSSSSQLPEALSDLEAQVHRFDDMLRSMYLLMSQAGRDRATLADYVFDLDLPGYSIQEVLRGDVIAAAGQRQAERQIGDILEAYRTDIAARSPADGPRRAR